MSGGPWFLFLSKREAKGYREISMPGWSRAHRAAGWLCTETPAYPTVASSGRSFVQGASIFPEESSAWGYWTGGWAGSPPSRIDFHFCLLFWCGYYPPPHPTPPHPYCTWCTWILGLSDSISIIIRSLGSGGGEGDLALQSRRRVPEFQTNANFQPASRCKPLVEASHPELGNHPGWHSPLQATGSSPVSAFVLPNL